MSGKIFKINNILKIVKNIKNQHQLKIYIHIFKRKNFLNINKKNLHLPNYYSSNDLINQYENTINELRKEIEFKYNNIINNEKGKESVIDILIK